MFETYHTVSISATPEGAPQVAPLGTTAIFRPLGSYGPFTSLDSPDLPVFRLLERYALQSAARSILGGERVSKCLRVPTSFEVHVNQTKATGKFNYVNLQTCGSVWHCPCCASKISERRKGEMTQAITAHTKTGGAVYLLTLTLPHQKHQALKTVVEGLDKAYEAFRKSKAYRNVFIPVSGLIGVIKATEVTYGLNGWHPHLHVLLFCNIPLSKLSCHEDQLLSIWQKVVVRQGMNRPNYHGLTLQNGKYAAKYVGKWSIENEMTKGHIKKSRSGVTPFDLLRLVVGSPIGSDLELDPQQARTLFAEYGKIFKGKRQLRASPGLYQRLGILEISDEEIADKADEKTTVFLQVPLATWAYVLADNLRGELLNVCLLGVDAAYDFLIDLSEKHGAFADC